MTQGYRSQRRKKRKRQNNLFLFLILFFVLLIVMVLVLLRQVNPLVSLDNLIKKTSSISKKQVVKKNNTKETKTTYLVTGLPAKSSKEKITDLFLIVVDFSKDKANGISIPGGTFADIPGYGFEKIGKLAVKDDISTMTATINNLLGIHIDHYIKSKSTDYKEFINVKDFVKIIAEATNTDMDLKKHTSLIKFLSKMNLSDFKMDSLPVKPLSMNGVTYYEPKKEEMNELILKIYGRKKGLANERVRVIVLNGSGLPGIAADVSKKLIDSGYKVVDNRNADNFKYTTTQIISFKIDVSEAIKVKKVLGLGAVIRKNSPQNLADIAVVVGRDYQNQ
ncbi:MAG: LCP family protein [Actinobacteria bacterium]|nr:LCP family protein [Actinomycetota bacterium]